jgi:hypothetical protein
VKDRWVKNGEVFQADSGGELVVNNPIKHRRNHTGDRDFESFHWDAIQTDCKRADLARLEDCVHGQKHSKFRIARESGLVRMLAGWLYFAAGNPDRLALYRLPQ